LEALKPKNYSHFSLTKCGRHCGSGQNQTGFEILFLKFSSLSAICEPNSDSVDYPSRGYYLHLHASKWLVSVRNRICCLWAINLVSDIHSMDYVIMEKCFQTPLPPVFGKLRVNFHFVLVQQDSICSHRESGIFLRTNYFMHTAHIYS